MNDKFDEILYMDDPDFDNKFINAVGGKRSMTVNDAIDTLTELRKQGLGSAVLQFPEDNIVGGYLVSRDQMVVEFIGGDVE